MARARKTGTESTPPVADVAPEPQETALPSDAVHAQTSNPESEERPSDSVKYFSEGATEDATDIPDTGPEADADLENPHSATGDQSITEASLPKPPRRRGVFFPMVVGGAVAAGLGFGAATVILPRFLTLPLPPTSAISDLDERLRSQSERIIAQTAQIDALKSDTKIADLAADQSEAITGIETQLTALNDLLVSNLAQVADQTNALDARITALEKRPLADGSASNTALEAFGRELAQLRAEIDKNRDATTTAQSQIIAAAEQAAARIAAAEAEATRLRDEAEAVGKATTARAALSRLQAALESGGSLNEPLTELRSTGVAIPPELAELAVGVPSFAALRASFPPAARKALAASHKETAGQGAWERIGAFLKSQTGARSLSPRAGDDPDAILSRAEAALNSQDLGLAISEIASLPTEGQTQMAEWVTMAQRRIATTDAIAAIAGGMN